MAEKWRLEGTLFDACNCLTLCPCNYFQRPTQEDCRPMLAWRIEKGNYGQTKLDGLNAAAVAFATGNPLLGIEKMAFIVDEKASPAQRDALGKIFGGQAGGMFAEFGKTLKQFLGMTFAKFDYSNDRESWWVKAGNNLDVKGGFVKPPPGVPMQSEPKLAYTYDPLFDQSKGKIVGITDHYRANVSGLNYDLSGRYSSAGKFRYEGP